jgi:hypothetical protein
MFLASYFVFSSNIIGQIKSRRVRWVGHVAHVGESRKVYNVLVGKSKGKDQSEDRCSQEDWFRIDLMELGCGEWI